MVQSQAFQLTQLSYLQLHYERINLLLQLLTITSSHMHPTRSISLIKYQTANIPFNRIVTSYDQRSNHNFSRDVSDRQFNFADRCAQNLGRRLKTQAGEYQAFHHQHINPTPTFDQYPNLLQSPAVKTCKPKISFSYNKEKKGGKQAFKTLPGSCRDKTKDNPLDRGLVKQFQLISKDLMVDADKKRRIKICSRVLQHSNIPNPRKLQDIQMEQTYDEVSQSNVQGSLNEKGNISKIASTEATTSYMVDADPCFSHRTNSKEDKDESLQFSSSKRTTGNEETYKLSLIDRMSPSKLLKKTIMLSKYDFGGMFSNQKADSSKNRKLASNHRPQTVEKEDEKWKTYVKCLFSGDYDLKQSIHCGPETPKQPFSDILVGFGRSVEASCMPFHE